MPLMGAQGKVLALLDLGCHRCVVSPEVVEKLGLRFQQLKVPNSILPTRPKVPNLWATTPSC